MSQKKFCFVIAPIGERGDDVRKQSDMVLKYIITPALSESYEIKRADDDQRPGEITSQMMADIERADLILVNLSGLNPNVMYELGVAHARNKKVIHLFDTQTRLPFDIRQSRSINFDVHDPNSHFEAISQIKKYEKALSVMDQVSNPFTEAMAGPIQFNAEDLKNQTISDLLSDFEELLNRVRQLELRAGRSTPSSAPVEDSLQIEGAATLIELLADTPGFKRVKMRNVDGAKLLEVYGDRNMDVSKVPTDIRGVKVQVSIQ